MLYVVWEFCSRNCPDWSQLAASRFLMQDQVLSKPQHRQKVDTVLSQKNINIFCRKLQTQFYEINMNKFHTFSRLLLMVWSNMFCHWVSWPESFLTEVANPLQSDSILCDSSYDCELQPFYTLYTCVASSHWATLLRFFPSWNCTFYQVLANLVVDLSMTPKFHQIILICCFRFSHSSLTTREQMIWRYLSLFC